MSVQYNVMYVLHVLYIYMYMYIICICVYYIQGKNSPDEQGKVLGTFEYKTDSTPIQTFDLVSYL